MPGIVNKISVLLQISTFLLLTFPSFLFGAQVQYVDTDAWGTPVAVVNSEGTVVWEAEYYPFGEEYRKTKSLESNNRRLIGKEKDSETGLTYFGARYFDERTGRFITVDPVGPVNANDSTTDYDYLYDPQRLNRYAYGMNNPYKYTDEDGRNPALTGAIGALIGGIYNGVSNWGDMSWGEWGRSVAVGIASGFVAGATGGVGGAVVGAGLNEIHEQTLQGKNITNYDTKQIAAAATAGVAASITGGVVQSVAKEVPVGGFKITKPSVLNPVDLTGKTYSKVGDVLSVPTGEIAAQKAREAAVANENKED